MAVLRELVAKLGFKVDDRGAKDFTKTLDGLKQTINTLAVAKLNQWAVTLEQTFEKTNRQLELIAKSDGFRRIENAVKGNRAGIFDQTQLRQAGVEFQKITNDADLFGKTLKATKEYATIVSQTPAELSRGFAEFVASGATGQMQELGLVTQQQLERLRLSGREYGKWTTHARKVELMNILTANAGRRQELYAKSLKDSDVQFSMLMGNFRKFGKSIGSFLNPVLAKTLGFINDLFTRFQNSPLAKTAAKFAAIAGGVTLVASAMVAATKVIMMFLSPVFIKIALWTVALTALFLIFEDIYKYITDPTADTWIGSQLKKFPGLKKGLDEFIQQYRDIWRITREGGWSDGIESDFTKAWENWKKLFKGDWDSIDPGESRLKDGLEELKGLFEDLKVKISDVFAEIRRIFNNFFESETYKKFEGFLDSIGDVVRDAENFIGGTVVDTVSNAVSSASNKIDSVVNVTVSGVSATANDVKNAVIDGVRQSPLGTVMKWIKGSNNMATGGP
ncbi:MAG: hypothetical protein HOD85_20685 [Deltaproteobacteria bacterium]|jgi:hypothetical protein|nr:hypothetical protein [Deltaproteobacteria bacterium]